MSFRHGLDVLLTDTSLQNELKGKKVGVLAHPASMSSDFEFSIDAISKIPGVKVTAAFGPQHGMRGEKQDNMVETEDYVDPVYKIPVFSLYGEVRRPTEKMFSHFDVLLCDMQDVGTRIYTFLTTLLYVLEAGAKYKKTIWILDRPNPAGRPIEGSLLKPGWISFVGAAEKIPMRHGLTLGEFANWFVKELKIDVDYKVIKMQGYKPNSAPGFGWPESVAWVNPSPNAANVNMARAFPGTVMLEGTNLSEGRGTTRPLEVIGAPDIDGLMLLKKMESIAPQWMNGAKLRACYFQPTFHKHAGKMCSGFQIHTDHPTYNHEQFLPYRLLTLAFKAVRELQPEYQIWRDFHYEYEKDRLAIDLINGGPLMREWVDDRKAVAGDFDTIVARDEKQWAVIREPYLLY